MAEKSKGPPENIPIAFAMAGFRKRMLFNHYAIIPEGDFRLLHFGYYSNANLLMDHFVCAIHTGTLEAQRQEILDYLGRLGELGLPAPPTWQPPATSDGVELITNMGFCRHVAFAEITAHNFSVKALLDLAKNYKEN